MTVTYNLDFRHKQRTMKLLKSSLVTYYCGNSMPISSKAIWAYDPNNLRYGFWQTLSHRISIRLSGVIHSNRGKK